MKFQDYYKILGLERGASTEQVSKAYKKLARKYHPDVNKEPGAEAKFKEIGEAYAVLKDPQKRARYDTLGSRWKDGQDFRPPPDWGDVRFDFGQGGSGEGFAFGEFSDFFEAIFGGGGRAGAGQAGFDFSGFGEAGGFKSARAGPGRGPVANEPPSSEAEITVGLEDVYYGRSRTVTLQAAGRPGSRPETKTLQLKIPAGTRHGSSIRLKGQGFTTVGATAADLLLKVNIAPHPRFEVKGFDLYFTLQIAPWEAVLGATVSFQVMDATVNVRIPPGSQSDQTLRLKEKGLLKKGGARGDLFAKLKIAVPSQPGAEEAELFEKLSRVSSFDPRKAK